MTTKQFPGWQAGVNYLTEGGQETELMYGHGIELQEFAMYPLLDDEAALSLLCSMYTSYLDTAARHGFGVVMGGLDYRASSDWASALGYAPPALAEMQLRCIDFLRQLARPYEERIPSILYAGLVGPRGDGYLGVNDMSVDEAREYHLPQAESLAKADVDLVEAMTFSSIEEATGLAHAAADAGLPSSISFVLDSGSRLRSGPTVGEAIQRIDELAGADRPAFYGINCSHPLELLPALDEPGTWFERVRVLRPNAVLADKVALCTLGHLESGDPAELGVLMGRLAAKYPHLDIWGGCCGTWSPHLDAIATNVKTARGLDGDQV